MQASFDYYNQLRDPVLYVCNPNNRFLAPVSVYSACTLSLVFQDASELSLTVPKYVAGPDGRRVQDCYRWLERRRQIHVEGVGYFQIDDINESDDGADPVKNLDCTSCETELNNKMLVLPEAVYPFYDAQHPEKSVLGKALALFPSWSAGDIDPDVAALYRQLNDTEETVFSFLNGALEEKFGCIVDFDIENRKINVRDANKGIPATDIFLSHDDAVENIQISSSSEDIITALQVSGDDLTFRDVNPTASDVIYRFTPFMNTDWMSQGLINKLQQWETDITSEEGVFETTVAEIQQAQRDLNTMKNALTELEGELKILQNALINSEYNSESRNQYLVEMEAKKAEIAGKNGEITAQNLFIEQCRETLRGKQQRLALQNYFDADEQMELDRFIYQSRFQDDTLGVTKNMTYEEKLEQAKTLYRRSKDLLKQLCNPRSSFSIDCSNFYFLKEFAPYHAQLKLGSLIHIELAPHDTASLILQKMELDFENKSFSMTFGNRYRLTDVYSRYEDLFGNIGRSVSEVSYNKSLWNYPIRSGLVDEMEQYISGTLNATKNSIITSDKEDIVIDSSGIHCRTPNDDGSGFDPNELWITHGGMLYTNDNFKTIKTALGKFISPDGEEQYGLVADALVGKMMLGNSLTISNANGSLIIDNDGIRSEQLDDINGKVNKISQDANAIQFDFYKGTGSNLLVNSTGIFDITEQNWETSGTVSRVEMQESASKSAFLLKSGASMSQTVACNEGSFYCFSAGLKFGTGSTGAISGASISINSTEMFQSADVSAAELSGGSLFYYDSQVYTADGLSLRLQIKNQSNRDLYVTDLMLVEGLRPKRWSSSANEFNNNNIQINDVGITVSNTSSDTKTIMDSESFRVVDQQNNDLIRVTDEETILKKTNVQNGLKVGNLQVVVHDGTGVDFILIGV